MLSCLNIYNMPPVELPRNVFEGFFTITTCQRTLIVGLEEIKHHIGPNVMHIKGSEAYGYLLETITGLKSQVLAESEIVCQFKSAFKSYLETTKRDGRLITILEKLFKDNKDIRSLFLKNIGQQSYTGISKKILLNKSSYNEVLILGSGTLAQALIKLLSKKFKIFLSARNLQKVDELKRQFHFQQIPWPMIEEFKKIIGVAYSYLEALLQSKQQELERIRNAEAAALQEQRRLKQQGTASIEPIVVAEAGIQAQEQQSEQLERGAEQTQQQLRRALVENLRQILA